MDKGRDVSRDTVMLTYEQLAARLGIDVQSARRRVLRHRWARTKGNDGKARVAVPATVLPAAGATVAATDATSAVDVPATVAVTPEALSHLLSQVGELAELRERLGHAEGERDGLQEALRRADAAVAEAHRRLQQSEERLERAQAAAREARERLEQHRQERDAEAAALRDGARTAEDRARAALARVVEAEARLEAASPAVRALKAWRAFLAQWKRP